MLFARHLPRATYWCVATRVCKRWYRLAWDHWPKADPYDDEAYRTPMQRAAADKRGAVLLVQDAAGRFLVETLTAKPSVRGLDRLVELKADGHLQAEASDEILKAVTERLMSRQPSYRCKHCGFSGQTHHWQCPSCRNWSTTKKIHGVLGE